MPRPERVLDPQGGLLQEFAAELRELRREAGTPSYRQLSATAGFSVTSLSDAAGGRHLPGLALTLAYVRACGGDEQEWEARWRQVAADRAAQRDRPDRADTEAPYQGLTCFDTADAGRFFGRTRLVEELVGQLEQGRFVTVAGPSGSGKSSLLRAGLVPALPDRPAVVFTPGERPVRQLELVRDRHRLVVVDQFEEVFTLCQDQHERERFVTALIELSADKSVVLGVRADFLSSCLLLPALASRLSGATVLVGPMSDEELNQAVTGPATVAGLTVERALVAQVLADAKGQSGALPLLSHALHETWRLRRSAVLTLSGYSAAGGISGAIAGTAERVYQDFDPAQQRVAREILIRLTALGDGTGDTRRRVRRAELDFPGAAYVVDQLVGARLLVVNDDVVDIAHEALISAWPRLHTWLAGDRAGLRVQRQLTEATRLWRSLDRDAGALYRGTRLAIAREWAAADQHRDALTGAEQDFLDASLAADAAERAAVGRRARLQRVLAVSLAVALLLVLAGAGATVGLWRAAVTQAHQATSEGQARTALSVAPTDVAQAMTLSLAAYRAAPTVAARGALLSVTSRPAYTSRLQQTAEVKDVVFSDDGTLVVSGGQDGRVIVWDNRTHRQVRVLEPGDGAIRTVASSGRYLAAGTLDGTVLLWDIGTGQLLTRLKMPKQRVSGLAFSRDGSTLAAIGADPGVQRWAVPGGQPLPTLPATGGQRADVAYGPDGRMAVVDGEDSVSVWGPDATTVTSYHLDYEATAVAFSPDGTRVATGGDDPDATLLDVATGKSTRLRGHTGYVRSLAFSADSQRLVSGGNDNFAIVWDVSTATILSRLAGHTAELYGVAVSAAGNSVATAGRDTTILTYDTADLPLIGHTDNIAAVATNPDGTRIASASRDKTVSIWDSASGVRLATLTGHTNRVAALAYGPDVLASASDDETIRLWDAHTFAPLRVLTGHTDQVYTLAYGPDGVLASGSADKTVRFWRPDGTPARPPMTFGAEIRRVLYSPDGRSLLVNSRDGLVTVVDLATGGRRIIPVGVDSTDIALSADGATIAVGDNDGGTTLWSFAGEAHTKPVRLHTGTVTALAFSPDGAWLAIGGTDQTVALWDVKHQTTSAVLSGGSDLDVLTVAWSPAGDRLYTAGADRAITEWQVRPADAIERLCTELATDYPYLSRPDCPH